MAGSEGKGSPLSRRDARERFLKGFLRKVKVRNCWVRFQVWSSFRRLIIQKNVRMLEKVRQTTWPLRRYGSREDWWRHSEKSRMDVGGFHFSTSSESGPRGAAAAEESALVWNPDADAARVCVVVDVLSCFRCRNVYPAHTETHDATTPVAPSSCIFISSIP